METYSWLRTFADSWMLVLMTIFFVGIVIFAFRPGSRKVHEETSNIIFRHEDRPAGSGGDNPDAEGPAAGRKKEPR